MGLWEVEWGLDGPWATRRWVFWRTTVAWSAAVSSKFAASGPAVAGRGVDRDPCGRGQSGPGGWRAREAGGRARREGRVLGEVAIATV